MTDEEFERLKEAEKEHLRAKKKLQDALTALQRKQRVRDVVHRMADSAQNALDRAADLIGRLTAEAAHDEARLDVAMEDTDTAGADAAEVEAFEAKRRTARAQELVRQMKQGEGAAPRKTIGSAPDEAPAERTPGATEADEDRSTSSTDDLPEKTIGRMR